MYGRKPSHNFQERATDPEAIAAYFQQHSIESQNRSLPSKSFINCFCSGAGLAEEAINPWRRSLKLKFARNYSEIRPRLFSIQPLRAHRSNRVLAYPIKDRENCISETVPLSRPINNAQIYLLDSHLQPVPLGVSGELYIGGAFLARGYLNQPQLTAARFIINPLRNAEGILFSDSLAIPSNRL